MRSQHLVFALALAGVTLLGGCQGDVQSGSRATVPELSTADSIYLVNPFTQKLVAYDRHSHRVTSDSSGSNRLYYGFAPPTDLFTAGDSVNLEFSLLEISGRKVSTLKRAEKDEGLFPLASTGTSTFLIKATYDSSGAQTSNSIVVREVSGNLRQYFEVPEVIQAGAVADGRLYYSVYNDSTELYDVYSFQIGNFSLAPRLERSGLASERVYAHHDEIIYPDHDAVQEGGVSFPCTDLCYFYDNPDIFVRVSPDKDAGLTIAVYDSAGALLGQATNLVGFVVTDKDVIAYCDGTEVSIPVVVS